MSSRKGVPMSPRRDAAKRPRVDTSRRQMLSSSPAPTSPQSAQRRDGSARPPRGFQDPFASARSDAASSRSASPVIPKSSTPALGISLNPSAARPGLSSAVEETTADHTESLAVIHDQLKDLHEAYNDFLRIRFKSCLRRSRFRCWVHRLPSHPRNQASLASQNVVRTTVQHLIGIDHKTTPPAALARGCFWQLDAADSTTALRPSWGEWGENSAAWVREVARKIQTDGARYHGAMKPSIVMLTRIYLQKAKLRASLRHRVPELASQGFDFLFQTKYQSTDESEDAHDSGAIDPDTESGSDGDDAATQKKWISRPPLYRHERIEPLLVKLDKAVRQARKGATQGNQFRIRERGAPADKALPKISRTRVKIPRSQVSTAWLAEHDDGNISDYMAGENQDRGTDGGNADGEENEDEQDLTQGVGHEIPIDPQLLAE